MPRKNPVPDDERMICRRLREFRESTGFSQLEFSRRVGISRKVYPDYEHGRVQVNYPAAYAVLMAFPWLSARWLAEESGPMLDLYFVTYPVPGQNGDGPRTLFSFVYSNWLKGALILSRTGWLSEPGGRLPLFRVGDSVAGRVRGRVLFAEVVRRCLEQVPDGKVDDFLNALEQRAGELLKSYPEEDLKVIRSRASAMAKLLLQISGPRTKSA